MADALKRGDEPSPARVWRAAGCVGGGDEPLGQTELLGELSCPGLFCHPAVGAALDHEAALAGGLNDASEAPGGFKEAGFYLGAVAGEPGEFIGCGDPGDSAADDCYAFD